MSSREQLEATWPEGTRVQAGYRGQHGPGRVAWQSAAAQSLGQLTQAIPVQLDRPPAGIFGGTLRFYFENELQALLA